MLSSTRLKLVIKSSMNLFQTKEYLAVFARHFCHQEDIVDGIWEKQTDKLILLGMKPVLGGEEVTDYGQDNLTALPSGYKNIQLDYIREDSQTYRQFKDKAIKVEVAPFIDLPDNWDDYLAGLERKHRKELKRKIKRLEEMNSFYQCRPETVKADFEQFVRLHRLSDPNKNRFMSEPMKAFFWDVVTATIPGWVTNLCFLKINDEPAAGAVTFVSEAEVWLYNSGYNPDQKYYSVGLLLKAHLIKTAIEAGKKKFDFLRGGERYKYELGAKDLQLYRIKLEL